MVQEVQNDHLPRPAEMIAEELNKLSFDEREKVFSDIHGVSNTVEETPEFVKEKLAGLEAALEATSVENKSSYINAKEQNKDYVNNRDFRLTFLRADNFDTIKAARRLIQYLDRKLGLFGPERLTKTITLEDFSEEDMIVARSGLGTMLPLRDQAGRLVLSWMTMLRGKSSFLSRVCIVLYCTVPYCTMAAGCCYEKSVLDLCASNFRLLFSFYR
jgi:hypothetical protein